MRADASSLDFTRQRPRSGSSPAPYRLDPLNHLGDAVGQFTQVQLPPKGGCPFLHGADCAELTALHVQVPMKPTLDTGCDLTVEQIERAPSLGQRHVLTHTHRKSPVGPQECAAAATAFPPARATRPPAATWGAPGGPSRRLTWSSLVPVIPCTETCPAGIRWRHRCQTARTRTSRSRPGTARTCPRRRRTRRPRT